MVACATSRTSTIEDPPSTTPGNFCFIKSSTSLPAAVGAQSPGPHIHDGRTIVTGSERSLRKRLIANSPWILLAKYRLELACSSGGVLSSPGLPSGFRPITPAELI